MSWLVYFGITCVLSQCDMSCDYVDQSWPYAGALSRECIVVCTECAYTEYSVCCLWSKELCLRLSLFWPKQ